jgi:hypothetical protein
VKPWDAVKDAGGRPEPIAARAGWPTLRTDVRHAGAT